MKTGDRLFALNGAGVAPVVVVAVGRDGSVSVAHDKRPGAFPVARVFLVDEEDLARTIWRSAQGLMRRRGLTLGAAVAIAREWHESRRKAA